MSNNFEELSTQLKNLQSTLEKRKQQKINRKKVNSEMLDQLQDQIQQKTDGMISKLQELKRKQTVIFIIERVQPQIPQAFPKNYFLQMVYQDVVVTGNQKFTDFDENIIDQKFIIPLLFSTIVKVQIWIAQQQPTLFDKTQINLQKDIQEGLVSEKHRNSFCFPKFGQQISITYRVQLQGIGFSAWLKNISELRQIQTQKAMTRQRQKQRKQRIRQKVSQKKNKFNNKFSQKKDNKETVSYENNQIDEILNLLKD